MVGIGGVAPTSEDRLAAIMSRIQRDRQRLEEQQVREAAAERAAANAKAAAGQGNEAGADPSADAGRTTPKVEPLRDTYGASETLKAEAPDAERRNLERVARDPAPRVQAQDEDRTNALRDAAYRERLSENSAGLDRRRAVPRKLASAEDLARPDQRRGAKDKAQQQEGKGEQQPEQPADRRPKQTGPSSFAPLAEHKGSAAWEAATSWR